MLVIKVIIDTITMPSTLGGNNTVLERANGWILDGSILTLNFASKFISVQIQITKNTQSMKDQDKNYCYFKEQLQFVVSDLIAGFGRETFPQVKSVLFTQAVAG